MSKTIYLQTYGWLLFWEHKLSGVPQKAPEEGWEDPAEVLQAVAEGLQGVLAVI